MAEAFLQILLENLNSVIQREVGLLWGVHKEMEKLSSTLSTIKAVIEDAEQKQLQDKAIRDWLQKLKDAAYEVDDILDDFSTEALQQEFKGQNSGVNNKVNTSFLACYPLKNVWFCHKIGNKMKEVSEKLDKIADDRQKYHLDPVVAERPVEPTERRQTGSIVTEPELFGRDEDKETIVEFLTKQASECEHMCVYPIIGMGGLGKTTLARVVFNEERITGHFDLRIWVCISEDFDVKRVIRGIIEDACGSGVESLDLNLLQRRLRDLLNGKRYLLVLDDVWNEDQEKWDSLKFALACGSRGASILATTRVQKVASIMGTLPEHHLSGLSEDDCWSLFRQRAFGSEIEKSPELVQIGKQIVRKCGGCAFSCEGSRKLIALQK